MRSNKLKIIASIILAILFVNSCKVGEDYEREEQNLPANYRQVMPADESIANIPW